MTTDYIVESMTWKEISLAMQFVNRYEEVKIPAYKNKVSFLDWVAPSASRSMSHLKSIAKKLKGGN